MEKYSILKDGTFNGSKVLETGDMIDAGEEIGEVKEIYKRYVKVQMINSEQEDLKDINFEDIFFIIQD
jgi:hypothetical protein